MVISINNRSISQSAQHEILTNIKIDTQPLIKICRINDILC